MNRMLTAAVALTAALGMAGLAHAQSSTSPNTMNPSSSSPGTTSPTGPAGTQNPATMGTTGATSPSSGSSYDAPSPQANSSQPGMNPGQSNQAQMNETSGSASRSQIQEAQQQLKSQGLYRGAVDGVMGPETQTAVMAFQREHSLPQTAQLDQQTLSALGGNGGSTGSMSTTGGTQEPGAAGMQPGGGNAPVPAGNMNSAPGSTTGGTATTR